MKQLSLFENDVEQIVLTQKITDLHTVNTTQNEIKYWITELGYYNSFELLREIDQDRIVYHIYHDQRWGENLFNNYERSTE